MDVYNDISLWPESQQSINVSPRELNIQNLIRSVQNFIFITAIKKRERNIK